VEAGGATAVAGGATEAGFAVGLRSAVFRAGVIRVEDFRAAALTRQT
jgi:hypothetical protein